MKIWLLSDLHLEVANFVPDQTCRAAQEADVVVLAGDIAPVMSGGQLSRYPDPIAWILQHFGDTPVIFVPGNHEFYGGEVTAVRQALRARTHGTSIHLLDDSATIIGGVRFLGATLWTDFCYGAKQDIDVAWAMRGASCLPDFNGAIRMTMPGQSESVALQPPMARQLHQESVAWLTAELTCPVSMPTVVVTHHMPAAASVAPAYAHHPLNAAFVSSLEPLLARADLWLHGHTHCSTDYRLGPCRVVCNPRGYVRSPTSGENGENPDFQPGCLLEL